jgi:inner membrane protein
MASAFAHAVVGAALWPLFRVEGAPKHMWLVGAGLAVLPDIDVVGFRFGVAYSDLLGHRGLTHSLLVAAALGALVAVAYGRGSIETSHRLRLGAYVAVATASHGVLDAMTTGGLGVALFAPVDNTRYFFPWRPIAVSPIGVRPFFTARGLMVLANEALWVGLPSLIVASLAYYLRRTNDIRRAA